MFNLLVSFLLGTLVGGAALVVAARFAVYRDHSGDTTLRHGVVTALLGALVWALLAWVPLIGTLLALGGWIALLYVRYPGGWTRAVITGVGAWAVAVVVLAALDLLGLGGFSAVGVPGT